MDPASERIDPEVSEMLARRVAAFAAPVRAFSTTYSGVLARVAGPLQAATEKLTASLGANVALLVEGHTPPPGANPLNLTIGSLTSLYRSWLWSVVVGQAEANAEAG